MKSGGVVIGVETGTGSYYEIEARTFVDRDAKIKVSLGAWRQESRK